MNVALAAKRWRGEINAAEHAEALDGFRALVIQNFTVLPVAPADFESAGRLAERANVGLRSADALHLAIVVSHRLALASFDKIMQRGAAMLGVALA